LSFGGHHVLADVGFDLRPGELVMIRGANGSGKTTLLNILSGYMRPDSGNVAYYIRGKIVRPDELVPEQLAEYGIGRTWQDIRLFPTMTVLDNVLAADSWDRDSLFGDDNGYVVPTRWLSGIAGTGLIGAAAMLLRMLTPITSTVGATAFQRMRDKNRFVRARAEAHLELVGMSSRVDSSCDKLSIGQMKRVALARALQKNPDILLLDEPLAGLDVDGVREVSMMLRRLASVYKKTVLAIEHRCSLEGVVDRVLSLDRGRLKPQ
jgi:branched-chain amino acid transport system ATP-binding protein